ncbi:hypothetical protein [Tropicibacter naphthalenivorans]|uniref:Uncharacterized protein n=1 Tax=Tropicibacter naphthalenivorans TaxID=441103 RepID=A0A0P1G3U4_9RHOB|nr:hypothetical protein [Tropicibacter naphthalenivorans]CUH76500.1 hypothetical protein TRN7648_00968 [Tropicibacter naphthalenivorans]SMC65755.1 hypothetical protein SAMN04488093_102650 [Tropicibacter naphthalenivorans]
MFDLILLIIAIATGGGGQTAQTTAGEAPPPGYQMPQPDAPNPLPYEAEQQVATGRFTTALEIKPIMQATRANWLAVREYDGQDLVYVTHLWSWRCGLVAIHYAVNDAPLEPWPLPACHEDTASPNAILPEDGLPYRSYPLSSVQTVTVELIYDDLTTEKATFNRQGALIP